MGKIRISAVKYANTYPFIWGLKESGFDRKAIIETDHPADCAAKLISGRADLGLIPVAAIPAVRNHRIISDFCIGANGRVRTVMLLSNCPFDELDTIYLDHRSISSVSLIKVLAKNVWKREFRWTDTTEGFDFLNIGCNEAVVLIGDQCFEYELKYKFRMDLAEEWKKDTGLPFVFACWVSNRELESKFIEEFNAALRKGVGNIGKVVDAFSGKGPITGPELGNYLRNNIDYVLDDRKREGMKLFLDMLEKL